jgi:hypothetical protein
MKGILPWLVHWACSADTRDFCPALATLVSLVQNIIFLTIHFFNSFVPIAQQAGQAVVLSLLSFSMYLCLVLSFRRTGGWTSFAEILCVHP